MKKFALAAALAAFAIAAPAQAQEFPSKPIRFIVPLTPGSGADIAGRILGKHIGDAERHKASTELAQSLTRAYQALVDQLGAK